MNATSLLFTYCQWGLSINYKYLDDLDSTFVKGKNIVFLETKEQGFVSNVTSILNSFVNDTIKIELVSTNKNNAFEGVNISNNYLSTNHHHPIDFLPAILYTVSECKI